MAVSLCTPAIAKTKALPAAAHQPQVRPEWIAKAEHFLADNLFPASDGDMDATGKQASDLARQAAAAIRPLLALKLERDLLGPLVEILTRGGLAEEFASAAPA